MTWNVKLIQGVQSSLAPVDFGETAYVDERRMCVYFPFANGLRRDGVGDLLEVGGIKTERHQKNPIVLFDHAKTYTLPVALTEDPDTKQYTVELDTSAKEARCKAFFYQGKSAVGDKSGEHELFCLQLFDLMARKFIRSGSIGYQAVKAYAIPADYQRGIPQGLHLQETNLLEVSAVVVPANQDTVAKALSLRHVAGKPMVPWLVKSLQVYAPPRKVQLGWEGKSQNYTNNRNAESSERQPTREDRVRRIATGLANDEVNKGNDWQVVEDYTERAAQIERGRYPGGSKSIRMKYQKNEKGVILIHKRPIFGMDLKDPRNHRYHVQSARDSGEREHVLHTNYDDAAQHADRLGQEHRDAGEEARVYDHAKGKSLDPPTNPSDEKYREDALAELDRHATGSLNERDMRTLSEFRQRTGLPDKEVRRRRQDYLRSVSQGKDAGEKRYRTYDNPLSNSDVPPARWAPGAGAVKAIRMKHRLGKSADRKVPGDPGPKAKLDELNTLDVTRTKFPDYRRQLEGRLRAEEESKQRMARADAITSGYQKLERLLPDTGGKAFAIVRRVRHPGTGYEVDYRHLNGDAIGRPVQYNTYEEARDQAHREARSGGYEVQDMEDLRSRADASKQRQGKARIHLGYATPSDRSYDPNDVRTMDRILTLHRDPEEIGDEGHSAQHNYHHHHEDAEHAAREIRRNYERAGMRVDYHDAPLEQWQPREKGLTDPIAVGNTRLKIRSGGATPPLDPKEAVASIRMKHRQGKMAHARVIPRDSQGNMIRRGEQGMVYHEVTVHDSPSHSDPKEGTRPVRYGSTQHYGLGTGHSRSEVRRLAQEHLDENYPDEENTVEK